MKAACRKRLCNSGYSKAFILNRKYPATNRQSSGLKSGEKSVKSVSNYSLIFRVLSELRGGKP
jgi:hypothetical protein